MSAQPHGYAHPEPDEPHSFGSDPVLETVAPEGDLDDVVGTPADHDQIEATINLEMEFLAALVWAPPPVVNRVLSAVVGTADSPAEACIPNGAGLFIDTRNADLFTLILALHHEDVPITPALLNENAQERGHPHLRELLITLASPNRRTPTPAGVELPYLARALVDRWYRRGYWKIHLRLGDLCQGLPTDQFASHWNQFVSAQTLTLARRTAIHAALAHTERTDP